MHRFSGSHAVVAAGANVLDAVAIRAAACWLAGCVARTFAARCVAALDDRQIFGNRELPVFNINLSSKPRPTDGAWYAAEYCGVDSQ